MNTELNQFLHQTPRKTAGWLSAVTFVLVVAHYTADALPDEQRIALKPFVNLTREGNLPSAYAGFLWVMAALSAAACWLSERFTAGKSSRVWMIMAVVLAYAAADEVASIHERLPLFWNFLRSLSMPLPDWGGEINMLWQIVYAPFVVSFFAAGLTLLWPRTETLVQIRYAFIAAIACFAAAIGFECIADSPLLAGRLYEIPFFKYSRIIYIGEEVLEDLGTILMIFSFMKYSATVALRYRMERLISNGETGGARCGSEDAALAPFVSK